ncbi:HCL127Wp [Eremothecium sinecaudum]|uniref:3-isopropylmalate dehydrogenase n=1 Tax=Eremothecium sinecaudum TaxID=45286 RepID=A0A0X8HRC0_9SACH|nr:HCL127Wp [Eremothecium sinecaudum]AMD20024.1 HCL127Wp [Eremothecium sinecaudum]
MGSSKKIVLLPGDHVGPEVVAEAVKVLKVVSDLSADKKLTFEHQLVGGAAITATGKPLPEASLEAVKTADAVLLGAVGGPEWGVGSVRPEQGLLQLRKELGLYANLRPCSFPSESLVDLSPLKADLVRGADFTVVRELVGGIYFGERQEESGDGVAWDTESYSIPEIERIGRMAGYLALQHDPPLAVHSVDKANVLASSRLWRKTMDALFSKEFPQVTLHHQLVDSAAMLLVKSPRVFNGIVVTSNMFGDILSDEASVIPGSIGLLPSASLSSLPDKGEAFGLYEPCHGSAPDLPRGKVNPVACILSAAMMLKYSLGMSKEGQAIEEAVKEAIDSGIKTSDLHGSSSTSEVGDAVAEAVKRILSN